MTELRRCRVCKCYQCRNLNQDKCDTCRLPRLWCKDKSLRGSILACHA